MPDPRGHDWPGFSADAWRCLLCGCLPASLDAKLACVGSPEPIDARPSDSEPAEPADV